MYKTLKQKSQAEYTINRSRFFGYAFPADNVDIIQNYIREYANRFSDATHCCWAYKTGFPKNIQEYYSDAGEPTGSAGRPILGVISQFDLQNILIIVIRYFGGVKLGIRGLIEAYSLTARRAIENAEIVKKQEMKTIEITIPYSLYNTVKNDVEKNGGIIINSEFQSDIKCKISYPKKKYNDFIELIRSNGILINE